MRLPSCPLQEVTAVNYLFMLIVRNAKISRIPLRLSRMSHPSETGHRPPRAAREAGTANSWHNFTPSVEGRRRELGLWDGSPFHASSQAKRLLRQVSFQLLCL